jgi:hypothetical protein
MDTPSPADVLRVWFGTDDPQGIVAPQMDRWFKTDADFDTRLRARFGAAIAAGIRGELAPWEDTPGGALALVILLDQFSRNAWRGDARSFAADPAALAAAERAVSAAASTATSHGSPGRFCISPGSTPSRSPIKTAPWPSFGPSPPRPPKASRPWALPSWSTPRSTGPSSRASAVFRTATPT